MAECFEGDNGDHCGTEATCTTWHDDDSCAELADGGNGLSPLRADPVARAREVCATYHGTFFEPPELTFPLNAR